LSFLLDTHVFIHAMRDIKRLSKKQRQAIARASPQSPLLLSTISFWEIANLVSLGRFKIDRPVPEWIDATMAHYPALVVTEITTVIAGEVAALADRMHRDPADRIIVATARIFGATLLTSDDAIVAAGVVRTQS
jgi:PIN domain nuclease of toxin-antitoxin system